MITKFNAIQNLAVFNNFSWDEKLEYEIDIIIENVITEDKKYGENQKN